MMKRISTFRKKREDTPPAVAGDGVGEGEAPAGPKSPKASSKRFSFAQSKQHKSSEADEESDKPADANVFEQFAQLLHASQRPMPTQTGDGSYIEKEQHSTLLQDLKSLGFNDFDTVKEMLANKGKLQDDKTMIMERVIQLVAKLPGNSEHRVDLTNQFLNTLWTTLEHPPQVYLGDKYKYRQADGSYNNILMPDLGKANTPYARTVFPGTLQPGSLPDPGLIFDCLFARREYREHPNRVSSILYYWASLIIHDLFQTNHRDYNLSQTSSYLDLSTLYGDTQQDQDQMRTFKDGMLKPDCFSEQRVLGMPPGAGVILIMFNRFHNYIAEQLALINENGRFSKPQTPWSKDDKAWVKYDHDLFNTARLITGGLYMNVTLLDYLRTIVGLNRTNSTWTLDPRAAMGKKVMGEDAPPRGIGNQVSCEFNLVYRWHSAISKKDEKWVEDLYYQLFGQNANEVSLPDLLKGLGKWEAELDKDPMKRPFAGLSRNSNGKFEDGELVNIIADAIEDVSGASGANHVPIALRAVEILGMQQARHWNCASLNEFRKFFGLKPHETFESINKDPIVQDQLRHLYEHPDFVEMYPGIVVEDAKEAMDPGVGICPTYTVSRAILSDAVVLVRSDRFYTIDYHPKSLTNWGYSTVQYDLNVEQGCVFYKLFLRAFPNHFRPNSIYAHQPMTVPSENRKIMKSLGREHDYDYERPELIPPRINLSSYIGAQTLLGRSQDFRVTWGAATGFVMGKEGFDFMLSGDTPFHAQQKQTMAKILYHNDWHKQIKAFYEDITLRLLHENSYKLASPTQAGAINQVDITRDVGNLAHCHFAANVFSLPMKTKENPRGVLSEHELYGAIAVIFAAIFFDFEPTKSFPLRIAARAFAQKLGKLIEMNVKTTRATGIISGLADNFRENDNALKEYGVHMIRKLLDTGLSVEEVTWSQILPVATAMIPNQSQVFTQMLDYYLSPAGEKHWPKIEELCKVDSPESDDLLMHYVMEGIRLNGTFGSYRESMVTEVIDDGDRKIPIIPGDKIFCSFVSANRDPKLFPNPNEVNVDRPLDTYIHYGIGMHKCLGMEASRVALTAMLRVVGRLRNLRRAPGPQGQLKKVAREGGFYVYMTENHGSYFPFPMTWKLQFDGDLPPMSK